MADETRIIQDGQCLGYTGAALIKYVQERVQREEKKNKEIEERDERSRVREHERQKTEQELKKKELELETLRLQRSNQTQNSQNAAVKIPLSSYKDGDDIGIFLKTFDRVRLANHWDESAATTALMSSFVGSKVASFIDGLPAASTLKEIETEILTNFGSSIYEYQRKFRFAKQGTEPFGQFVLFLKENLSKMCTLAKVEADFTKLEELVIKDQILRSAEKNLSEYLKEKDIFKVSLDKVAEMGDNFQAIHGRRQVQAGSGRVEGSPKCFICSSHLHLARECPRNDTPTEPKEDLKKRIQCYNCKEMAGHLARNCPQKQGGKVFEASFTSNMDMTKRDLPVVSGKCNGKNVNILRDTGCTYVLVRKHLVKPNFMSGETITLKLADNRLITVPKAEIYLKSKFYNGTIEAACMSELPFDVIIGNVKGAHCACGPKNDNSKNLANMALDSTESYDHACVVTRAQAQEEVLNFPRSYKIGKGEIKLDVINMKTKDFVKLQQNDPTLKPYFKKI